MPFEVLVLFLPFIVMFMGIYHRHRRVDDPKEKSEADCHAAENPDPKEMGALSRWWRQSYIREVYVVRAERRFWRCAIPWMGVYTSELAVVVFVMWSFITWLNPPLPLHRLTEREGRLIEYTSGRKGSARSTFLLSDGSTRSFPGGMSKEIREEAKKKNIRFWTHKGSWFNDSDYEEIEFILMDENKSASERYEEYLQNAERVKEIGPSGLSISLKFLLFFLLLIWLINIRPLKRKNQSTIPAHKEK